MEKETRTYTITGTKDQLDILERVFGRIELLGVAGSSRNINIYVDGDGSVRMKFRRDDRKLDASDVKKENGGFMITDQYGNVKVDLG
jgi:hypothetical protein